jgi:hypothetical protein
MADSPRSAAAGLNLTRTGATWNFTTAGSGGVSTPFGGTPWPVPGVVQAEDFDDGGPGVAYVDTTAGNSGGRYRSTDVDIATTSDAGGGYNVGFTAGGEWLQYTINVAASDTYTLDVRYANRGGSNAAFHVEIDGVNVTGSMVPLDTGGWQTWQTLQKPGIALTAGVHVVRLALDRSASETGSVANFNSLRFTSAASTPPTPFDGTPANVPGIIQAENFDNGGANVGFRDTTTGNSGGAYRQTDVDVTPTTDAGGGYHIGYTAAGEWLRYTINVTTAGTYTLNVRYSNRGGTNAAFHVEVDGVDVTGPMVPLDTGGWQTWQTLQRPGIALTAGSHVVRLVFDRAAPETRSIANINYLRFQ